MQSRHALHLLVIMAALPVSLFALAGAAGAAPQGNAGAPPTAEEKQLHIRSQPYGYSYALIDNAKCLQCHSKTIDPKTFAESAHGSNSCTSCHWNIKSISQHEREVTARGANVETPPVDCSRCHDKEASAYDLSIHHQMGFGCTDCHTRIHELKAFKVNSKGIYGICTNCHNGSAYAASVHGKAALAGNPDAPVCTHCHGRDGSLHDIEAPKGMASKLFHTAACAACHADKARMERNHVDPLATATYYQSLHGEIEEVGYPAVVAGCSDCHAAHGVLPASDPKSTIAKDNLVKTCRKCHPTADARFVEYIPHLNYKNPRRPTFYWPTVFMHGLLIGVFGFFWAHTFLFWRKDYWVRWRERSLGADLGEEGGKIFQRFTAFDRILHFMLLCSFMALVLTGLPLAFPGAFWAPGMMRFFGGFPTRGLIHRGFACLMTAAFTATIAYGAYFLFFKKLSGRPGFWERFFGPDSLVPRLQDFRDLWAMLKWFVDKGPRPEFDRWAYWEKFDFFAVFWGMVIIGTSGMVRWFPTFFTRLLPGWVVNIAVILHSDEALLAVGFIFTVHFFNNHLRPRNFPLNTVMFTGRLPEYQLREDHGLQVERLVRDDRFPTYERSYPNVWVDLAARLLALVMLTIGGICLALIAWRFVR